MHYSSFLFYVNLHILSDYIWCICCLVLKLQLYHCSHEGCDYTCPSKNGINLHLLKHAEPDAFACEICGKTFKRQAYVRLSVLGFLLNNVGDATVS